MFELAQYKRWNDDEDATGNAQWLGAQVVSNAESYDVN
jgi:hypothetical protein